MHQTSTANTQNNDWTVWCAPRFVWKNKFKLMQKTNYSKLLARCWRSNGHANVVAHCSSENYDEWQVRSVRVLAVQLAPKRKSTKYQLLSLFSHTCAIFMCAKRKQHRHAQPITDSAFVRAFEHRRIVRMSSDLTSDFRFSICSKNL